MNYCTLSVDHNRSSVTLSPEETMGHIVRLLNTQGNFRKIPLDYLIDRIAPPIELKQLKLFFSPFGRCLGFASWAYLAPDVESMIVSTGHIQLGEVEWNEGRSVWLVDFATVNGAGLVCLEYLRDETFREYSRVRYVRRKGDKSLVKQVDRNTKYSFFGK